MRLTLSRLVSLLTVLLFIAALGSGAACFALGLDAESKLAQAFDGALVLIDLACATALSFLIWPRRI